MQEITLDKRELERLIEKIDQAPDILKEAKRQAFEQAAPQMKQALDSRIGGTGKVRSWQEQYVGTEGGYAAVRPKAKTWAENNKGKPTKYQVGYVTNAINSGHRIRAHGKAGMTYGFVFGRHFYEKAQPDVSKIAQETATQIVDALAKHLEG